MTSRTTIRNIDPDALWDAKIHAAATQQRLGDVVTEAIQKLIFQYDTEHTEGEGITEGQQPNTAHRWGVAE
ncbi:hypothetical protein ASD8599_01384 [Ascidiaceihabitans donghaensis]|uniref:Uncharacterized protein n=1 Tax=Ascidiaceihabitans donghaensis TaxID=1510460 RepID=A0A2R8BC75_9RHOB|nr:hypothetical protein [Ascidiaceihabitans donghaensis]SPH20645.1 hypothetical protein ASD8599_01384 [Ascidiaceihabitans donghaensis]